MKPTLSKCASGIAVTMFSAFLFVGCSKTSNQPEVAVSTTNQQVPKPVSAEVAEQQNTTAAIDTFEDNFSHLAVEGTADTDAEEPAL